MFFYASILEFAVKSCILSFGKMDLELSFLFYDEAGFKLWVVSLMGIEFYHFTVIA